MKGLELSKKYFQTFGLPMLEENFADIMPYLAVGLLGSGSECFGYDDAISTDHDFEPGFCIFLPGEDIIDRRKAFLLERMYAKLPKEFEGFSRPMFSPVGGARKGVFRTDEFFAEKIGSNDGELSLEQWLKTPEHYFAEATNGEVFFDNFGQVSKIREKIAFFPENIFKKKLAGNLLIAAQSGQYNFKRCLSHGEEAAAQLSVFEFVQSAMRIIFLLNGHYMPYYKWSFRAFRDLPVLPREADIFKFLITTPNDKETAEEKYYAIEGVCSDIVDILRQRDLTTAICGDLEKHAYSVNDMIDDSFIRNINIFSGV